MTANELVKLFNTTYGIDNLWPDSYEVDYETYANVCQAVFDYKYEKSNIYWDTVIDGIQKPNIKVIPIFVGMNRGIVFKNVEIILRRV